MGRTLALKRYLFALLLFLVGAGFARANQAAQGWCESGAQIVITSGLTSTTQVQASFPSCTVTVFIHGGGLATISSDNNAVPTPLANPFTAQTGGQWQFYAPNGRYDIQLSGAGFPSPVTYSDVLLNDPGSGGGGGGGALFGVYGGPTPCSSSPVFNATNASVFFISLTCDVTSPTVVNPVQNGQVIEISFQQDSIGGHLWTWPINFSNTACYVIGTPGNSLTSTAWYFNGSNWQPFDCVGNVTTIFPPSQGGTGSSSPAAHGVAIGEGPVNPFNFVLATNNGQCFMSDPTNFATVDPSFQACPGGGGGGSSQGTQGTAQAAGIAGAFQVMNIVETGGPPGTLVAINEEMVIGGNNPYHDLRIDGARKMVANATPAVAGVTLTIANGANSGTVSTNTCSSQTPTTCFQIKDGVTIVGPGAAHAMVTPAAPVLTQVLNGVMTGISSETVTSPAGAITYNGQIFEVNKFGGYTAASPITTITTSKTLGMQHVNIATCQRTNNISACVTSTPHGLPIGCTAPPSLSVNRCPSVLQNLTNMTDLSFAGEKAIQTVADNTHYTYIDNVDTRTGASSGVATGGVLYWGQAVHYVLPAHSGDGMWYVACSDRVTPGVFKAVGVSWPKNFNGGVPDGVLEINDWGATMNGANPTMPLWSIPTTCPTVASADMLTTTVTNVVGTTLTFASSAANAVCAGGGCSIVIDTAPILANVTKAYPTYFAGVGSNSNNYYIFNSTVDFSTSNAGPSLVGGWVQINAPFILGNSTWVGSEFYSNRDTPSFGFGSYPTITCLAKPCVWLAASSSQQSEFGRLEINMAGGGGNIAILVDGGGGGAGAYLHDIHTQVGADFTGFALLTRASAPIHGSRMNFLAQNTPTDGDTFTPLVVFSGGETRIDQMNTSGRGIFTRGDVSLGFDHIQGGIEPIVTATGNVAGGNKGILLQLGWNGGIEFDTIAHAGVAYLPGLGSANVNVQISGSSPGPVPSSGVPIYTGQPVNNNGGTCQDPTYGSPSGNPYACTNAKFSSHIELVNTYSFFTDTLPNTLTCSVGAGGNVTISSQLQYRVVPVWGNGAEGKISNFSPFCPTSSGQQTVTVNWTQLPVPPVSWNIYQQFAPGNGSTRIRNDGGTFATSCNSGQIPGTATSIVLVSSTNCATPPSNTPAGGPVWIKDFTVASFNFNMSNVFIATEVSPPANPPAGLEYWFANLNTHQFSCLNSAGGSCMPPQVYPGAGIPLSTGSAWGTSYLAVTGQLLGTGQSNTITTGIQDLTAATAFRPKSGLTSALPATCSASMDVYVATDAQPGRNWYFCTSTNTWTQQINSGFLGLNTYAAPHTMNISESWGNFTASTTVTIPRSVLPYSWVVYCTSTCGTLIIAPDFGNITLNGAAPAATASITSGFGVEVACDGTNCFAWGLGGSGGGSGSVSSCTVNGPAYYTAATTVNCVTPPTAPNGVPSILTSTPSGGVSQPPALSLPGITGRAVSGITAVDTILSTDCNPNRVEYIGSVAVAVTLPTAVTLGVPKCVFKLVNNTSPPQTVSITSTTWTLNGSVSALNLTFGQQLWVYVDPNSATNWVADQTDLFGNVSGGAVPASAKIIGTNVNNQLIAAALSNTHIYVGNGSNLPADVAVSLDATLANTGAITVIGANGGLFPASAHVLGTNSSKQPVAATGHDIGFPLTCPDSSGSGSVQVCNTTPPFTPVAGDAIIYTTTTSNTGASLTINVNSLGAKPAAKWQTSTTLVANDIRLNTEVLLIYDGTNWEISTIGNAPAGGGGTPCTVTALSLQYNNAGAFGCVTEFTYASSTITVANPGKIDMSGASVTAALLVPKAAGAAPTNGGIVSYNTTTNDLVWGNATNTSSGVYFTTPAPTTLHLAEFNGVNGRVDDSGIATANVCAPGAYAAQTDAATVTWAIASATCANASLTFTVHSGSRTLNITNPVNGGTYILKLVQDATGGEGLTLGTGCTWKVSGGGAGVITLSTGASNIDVLSFTYDGTNCLANFNKLFN